MNKTLRISLQVGFLLLFIYALAAIFGAAPGASVTGPGLRLRLGKTTKRRKCYGTNWPASGMVGELVATPGTNAPPVGWPGAW
jgi:hypothetical protein